MKRNLDQYLIQWKKRDTRKPLLLRGARQTGKTYAIKKLGESFDVFVNCNFEKNPELGMIFNENLDPKRIISELEIFTKKSIQPETTLLFFDEIQICPKAVTSLRYFYEEMPQLHIVGAGSLLEFIFDSISIPVGRIEFVYVRPFTFKEFIDNNSNGILSKKLEEFDFKNCPTDTIHKIFLNELRKYLFLGGMPGAINLFIKNNSLQYAIQEQESILSTYREDFNKYCGRAGTDRITKVYDSMPLIACNQINYSKIDPDVQSKQIKKAIELLEKANVITKVKATSGAGLPLEAGSSEKRYKLLFLDTGLLQNLSRLEYQDWINRKNIINKHSGTIAEQFVGQELFAHDSVNSMNRLYYWERYKKGSIAEIDYLITISNSIFPLEVKSTATGHLKSLKIFLNKYPSCKFGLKISENNFRIDKNILSVPLYAISELNRLFS